MLAYIRRAQRPNSVGRRSIRVAQRASGITESALRHAATPLARRGFPYRKPTVPRSVEVPKKPSKLGGAYDTEWARTPIARAMRGVIVEGPMRLAVRTLTSPTVHGLDRLSDLERAANDNESPAPVIFAPNHHSHFDTGLVIRSIPAAWRRELVVAAAADYFFDAQWKAVISALSLNAIPIDREMTGRTTSDRLRDLIADGNSLIIYPEGGRSPDGWGQEFKGGAAYLAARTGVAVIPVFIDGTSEIFGKGAKRPKPGRTTVTFGAPMWPGDNENTRRFNARIQSTMERLGDEALTDYWTASRRAADGNSPSLTGPEYSSWRRQWQLGDRRRRSPSGRRRPRRRTWPAL